MSTLKKAIKRTSKYKSKNDPFVIALRYKLRSIVFRPIDIQQQIELDAYDGFKTDFMDSLGLSVLNRKNVNLFLQEMPSLIVDKQSDTQNNEIDILASQLGIETTTVSLATSTLHEYLADREVIEPYPFGIFSQKFVGITINGNVNPPKLRIRITVIVLKSTSFIDIIDNTVNISVELPDNNTIENNMTIEPEITIS